MHPGTWNVRSMCHASICSSVLCLITTKIWSDGHESPRHVTALRSWTNRATALRQISATAPFYLEDSRRIHPQSVRSCQLKDSKRREWRSAGVRRGERERVREGEREKERMHARERESALAPPFICFFLHLDLPYANWA